MFYNGYMITKIEPYKIEFEKIKTIDDILNEAKDLISRTELVLEKKFLIS
jgi:hypothetical protein